MSVPLYNSRIVDTYIRLIKSRYSHVDINMLLKIVGMEPYEVADQGHWFTQEEVDSFYEAVVQMTGNSNIALEAGRYAASPEALGAMRQYILGLTGPAGIFASANKVSKNLTRSSTYESAKVTSNSVEVIVTPKDGVSEKPFQCQNRFGFLEAIVLMSGHNLPHIEHPQCIFKGASSCRYIISWKTPRSLLYKRIGAVTTLIFVMISLALAITHQMALLQSLMQLFVPIVLLLVILVVVTEKNQLLACTESSNHSSDKLIEQLDFNYNSALMVNEIGQILNSCTNSHDVLLLVTRIMKNRLDFDRGLIFLADPERSRLVLQASFGYSPEHIELLNSASLSLNRPDSEGVFYVSFQEQKPLLVNDMNKIEESLSPEKLEIIRTIGTQSFICCPIISEDVSIGLLVVDNITAKRQLVASDIRQLTGIASIIGLGLRTVELIAAKVGYEKEQLKIDKLESLGILAGGIAHDFKNILTVVMGNISLAQLFLDPAHKSNIPLLGAEQASIRATQLAHQLLTFARGGEPVKKVSSIQHLVNETVSLVLHGSKVKGIVDIPDSIHAVDADEGQLSQVFHNLIINATQAMPAGGTLTVSAHNETLDDVNSLSIPAGRYVRLTFTDQGCGISADTLKKIFDPYFTTKPTGNGLGLASVHSIVKKHGGHITASSVLGEGTTFTIHLPSTGETYSAHQNESVPQVQHSHKGRAILVMDDDEMILEMTTAMLEHFEYAVTTCKNGAEALERYKVAMNKGVTYSAVIMDLTIPGGMGGKETAQLILAIDPDACLIVSSGYSNDAIMSEYSNYGFAGAVAKPYKIAELGQLLNSLISARPATTPVHISSGS